MRNVYLIISDIHKTHTKKSNRKSYLDEVMFVDSKIESTVKKYKDQGCKVFVLFLGDIADRSYKVIGSSIKFTQWFSLLNKSCDGLFTVIGNHEMSFYKDNPTWSLFNHIESARMKTITDRNYYPQGLINEVRVVDTLEDGNVVFHFNHNPLPVKQLDKSDKINIGLFHHDLISVEIMNMMKSRYGMEIFDAGHTDFTRLSILENYNYAFLGHMHKAYGQFINVDDTTGWRCGVYYLASLSRPNVSEVSNKFLERNIPAVIIQDGVFQCIEDNKFALPSREMSVKEEVVEAEKEKYEEKKYIKSSKELIVSTSDPVDNLVINFRGTREEYLFNSLKDNTPSIQEIDMVENFRRLMELK